jgi:hypothetical protein
MYSFVVLQVAKQLALPNMKRRYISSAGKSSLKADTKLALIASLGKDIPVLPSLPPKPAVMTSKRGRCHMCIIDAKSSRGKLTSSLKMCSGVCDECKQFVCDLHSTVTIRHGAKTTKCDKCENFLLGIAGDNQMLDGEGEDTL